MKKVSFLAISICFLFVGSSLVAKCYNFSNGGDVQVCVNGDGFSDRKKAKEICKKAKGSDCGNISSNSSRCHSNSGKCYNENGKPSRELKGY
ncbi:MAG: hypothetical protein KDK41_13650 [Leptospiraceae bacterium]|nr:hypothetical protein [Leptospiraceae bacterium]MCB1201686.1 hypothetical protein [Leptospiraceae bacterium]